jgi:hypothetical protein
LCTTFWIGDIGRIVVGRSRRIGAVDPDRPLIEYGFSALVWKYPRTLWISLLESMGWAAVDEVLPGIHRFARFVSMVAESFVFNGLMNHRIDRPRQISDISDDCGNSVSFMAVP